MPETEVEIVTKEWLQTELRSAAKDLIILDCRSSNEYTEGHIRSAVNFSIPSIMLRRLAAGKIDMLSTIKSRELKDRIQSGYKVNLFVLYNDNCNFMIAGNNGMTNIGSNNSNNSSSVGVGGNCDDDDEGGGGGDGNRGYGGEDKGNTDDNNYQNDGNNSYDNDVIMDFVDVDLKTSKYYNHAIGEQQQQNQQQLMQQQQQQIFGTGASSSMMNFNNSSGIDDGGGGVCSVGFGNGSSVGDPTNSSIINVLHRRLKQDGCRVVCLQGGFSSFRDAFPEWCEEDTQNQEMESSRGTTQADQLMGLRSLRISTPHSDSACSSSAESSDCESTTHYHHHHHHLNDAPVEIVPGLFLGNASHSRDSSALQKYHIEYVLNVTPDLPNHFEASGCGITYLQIPIADHYSQNVAVHFPDAIQFIDHARTSGSAVLVHCLAGVSRSVTVTLAYLMQTLQICLNDAFTLVRDRKPDVAPNFHFMEQLHSFERQLGLSTSTNTLLPNSVNPSASSSSASSTSSSSTTSSSSSSSSAVTVRECEKCPATQRSKYATPCGCSYFENHHLHNHDDFNKCMHTDFLTRAKTTGVSPDSGIEFDRWTPSSDGGSGGGGGGLK